jgi:hypothetical protein
MVKASIIKLLTAEESKHDDSDIVHNERTEVIFLRYVNKEKQRKHASAVFRYATFDHRIRTDGIGFQVLDNGPTRFNKHSACCQWKLPPALK